MCVCQRDPVGGRDQSYTHYREKKDDGIGFLRGDVHIALFMSEVGEGALNSTSLRGPIRNPPASVKWRIVPSGIGDE